MARLQKNKIVACFCRDVLQYVLTRIVLFAVSPFMLRQACTESIGGISANGDTVSQGNPG